MLSLMKLFKPRHWLFLNRLVSTPVTTTLFTLSEYTSHTNTVSIQCCGYRCIHCNEHRVHYAYMVRIHQGTPLYVHFQSTSVLRLLLEFENTAPTSPGYTTVCTFSEYITVVSLLLEFEYTAVCTSPGSTTCVCIFRVHHCCIYCQSLSTLQHAHHQCTSRTCTFSQHSTAYLLSEQNDDEYDDTDGNSLSLIHI